MYHAIIEWKLRQTFDDINAGHYEKVIEQFAPELRHAMFGRHALSGERHTLESIKAWYARLQRLLPDLRFEVTSVAVAGWPWDTRALVAWKDAFTLPDGTRGQNQGVHAVRIAWGKVRELEVHCDTSKLEGYCARLEMLGVREAIAAPISDPPQSVEGESA
jgi:ketosteroid isomerase-like protein